MVYFGLTVRITVPLGEMDNDTSSKNWREKVTQNFIPWGMILIR